MSVLEVSSLTDFLLSAEALFSAGVLLRMKPRFRSAACSWALCLFSLGIGALLGGIDHGFLEPRGGPLRTVIQKGTWLVFGALAFLALLAVGRQFAGQRGRAVLLGVASVQLGAYIAAVLVLDDSLVLIADTAPVLLVFLALCLRGLRTGKGSWQMAAGLSLCIGAVVLAAAVGDRLSPVDRFGLYHLGIMTAVPFLCLGGARLETGTGYIR